jgi:hypothetical protein
MVIGVIRLPNADRMEETEQAMPVRQTLSVIVSPAAAEEINTTYNFVQCSTDRRLVERGFHAVVIHLRADSMM